MPIIDFLAPHFVWLNDPTAWVALLTLVVLEIVLGIDNLIFISILTNKLPEQQRVSARRLGISAALVMRLVLLATISLIVQLTTPLFTLFGHAFSWRDLILIAGGLFLVWKATKEIHHTVDPDDHKDSMVGTLQLTLGGAIFQILLLDLVFSIDSIITAVGMTDEIAIMYIAVIVAVAVMMLAATPLADFIAKNPTIVMLALGFLLMIGMTLIADGMGYPCAEGLHLRGHGLLGAGRGAEHAGAAQEEGWLRRSALSSVWSQSFQPSTSMSGWASRTMLSSMPCSSQALASASTRAKPPAESIARPTCASVSPFRSKLRTSTKVLPPRAENVHSTVLTSSVAQRVSPGRHKFFHFDSRRDAIHFPGPGHGPSDLEPGAAAGEPEFCRHGRIDEGFIDFVSGFADEHFRRRYRRFAPSHGDTSYRL